MSEPELTAHEILSMHVTNVSSITAKAISNAVQEHNKLRTLFDGVARERMNELTARPSQPQLQPEATAAALAAIASALETLNGLIKEMRALTSRMVPLLPAGPGQIQFMTVGPVMGGGGGGGPKEAQVMGGSVILPPAGGGELKPDEERLTVSGSSGVTASYPRAPTPIESPAWQPPQTSQSEPANGSSPK